MTLYISPYRRMATLRQAMDRMLEENITEPSTEREMMLAVDVLAHEDDYVIRALIPGLDPDKVSIEVVNDTVSIRGEFLSNVDESEQYLISELPTGRFTRVITLPTALDPTKAEANIKNGALTLRVPKAESHRPKAIKVSAN